MRDRADIDDGDVGAVRGQRRLAVPGVGDDGVVVPPRRIQADGSLLIASTRTPAVPRTVRCSRAVRLEAFDSSPRNRVTGTS